jgi:hypothetical protein
VNTFTKAVVVDGVTYELYRHHGEPPSFDLVELNGRRVATVDCDTDPYLISVVREHRA